MDFLKNSKDYALELITKWHNDDSFLPNIENTSQEIITKLARFNYDLWHEEDKARDIDATDSIIATVKRKIDKLNQNRNDTIEKLDSYIYEKLKNIKVKENATMNSETPGSIVDRIIINSLKIYHMDEQTKRNDVDDNHILECKNKLNILQIQADDLQNCLNNLIEDLITGNKYMKVYKQMKMYNDPNLNPVLYKK